MAGNRGIPPIALADGPAGLRLTKIFHTKDGELVNEFQTPTPDMERLLHYLPNDAVPAVDLKDTTEHYQYCTAITIDTLLAQTWDCERIRQAGEIVGREMELFGVSLWLAPGMNIQRDPLCGRNFEYYSEDPLVSGQCASACTAGVQSRPGVGITVKHFACNNQEDNRLGNNSHVSERALREIYLKGFEICVRQAQPKAMMTSYNLLNGVHTANNYDLLTAALRQEWGYRGIVMTDWGTTEESLICMLGANPFPNMKYPLAKASGCVKAGNDLTMPGAQGDIDDILYALRHEDAEYPLSLGEIQRCAGRMLEEIYSAF
ncbi:MAG: hypothetical protein LUI87_01745 [Lachnospiraceae bacterium]|nr:hypothetical protein [Lachnospiraceae bacterium]